jgi:hypothetical protein
MLRVLISVSNKHLFIPKKLIWAQKLLIWDLAHKN